MKKLLIMMCVSLFINIAVIIISLWSSPYRTIIMYRMAILCNLALFGPSLGLIFKELRKTK